MGLEGKTVLVTGGARGLGAAISRELARAGASIVVADLNLEGAQSVAQALQGRGRALELDLRKEDEVASALEAIGRLDVLVNNAAVDFTLPIDELSVAPLDAGIGGKLRAPVLLSQQPGRGMKGPSGGPI